MFYCTYELNIGMSSVWQEICSWKSCVPKSFHSCWLQRRSWEGIIALQIEWKSSAQTPGFIGRVTNPCSTSTIFTWKPKARSVNQKWFSNKKSTEKQNIKNPRSWDCSSWISGEQTLNGDYYVEVLKRLRGRVRRVCDQICKGRNHYNPSSRQFTCTLHTKQNRTEYKTDRLWFQGQYCDENLYCFPVQIL